MPQAVGVAPTHQRWHSGCLCFSTPPGALADRRAGCLRFDQKPRVSERCNRDAWGVEGAGGIAGSAGSGGSTGLGGVGTGGSTTTGAGIVAR